jgi:putative solute:sodium symporter small subunit
VFPKEEDKMQLSPKQVEYWGKNLKLTAVLLAIWFFVTYVFGYFALPLSKMIIPVLNFPAAYYIAAQGALIVYVVILLVYARKMRAYDVQYGVDEGEE